MSHAYFLIAHGSPSASPQQAMVQLVKELAPLGVVGWGALEGHEFPLDTQLRHFCQQAQDLGQQQVTLLPLFLLPGNHVSVDVPAAIAAAQAHLPLPLHCLPFLGSQPRFQAWLQEELNKVEATILVGHGSRRSSVLPWFQQLCQSLGVLPALLTEPHSLRQALAQRRQTGHGHSHLFGYLLFGGKTVEALKLHVAAEQSQHPSHQLQLWPAIAPTPEFVATIAAILGQEPPP